MAKIQIIQPEEGHCLSQDLARIFSRLDSSECSDMEVLSSGHKDNRLKAHSFIIRARSPVLFGMIKENEPKEVRNLVHTFTQRQSIRG